MVFAHFHHVIDDKMKLNLVKNTAGPTMNQFETGNSCLSYKTYPDIQLNLRRTCEGTSQYSDAPLVRKTNSPKNQ